MVGDQRKADDRFWPEPGVSLDGSKVTLAGSATQSMVSFQFLFRTHTVGPSGDDHHIR